MTLCDGDQRNLNMLATAFENHDIAVIECQVIATGQIVPVICAVTGPEAVRSMDSGDIWCVRMGPSCANSPMASTFHTPVTMLSCWQGRKANWMCSGRFSIGC